MIGGRVIAATVGVAIVFLVAGLTHLSAILILPSVAVEDAYTTLASITTAPVPGHMNVLPPARPGATAVPFRDPAVIQGFCFFDLSKGPLRIKTRTEEGRLLTLSFRTRKGRIFYSMTDHAAFHDTIDIRLVTEAQARAVEADDDDEQGLPPELRLQAPSLTGLVVATALVARPGEARDAAERIKAITCASETLPAPS